MGFKELVLKEDWDKTPESIKNVAEEIFSNLNDFEQPGYLPNMDSETPGPEEDWEMTPESVQELIMDLAYKTIDKARQYGWRDR